MVEANGHAHRSAPPADRTFAGKVAFITGGASGIGLATARQLASRGAAVSIVDLRLEAAEQTARDLTSEYGVPAIGVGCNVAEQAQVEAAVATTVDRLGGVHLALNSAGIPSKGGMFAEYPVDDFRRMIDIHLIGCFLCVRAELTAMLSSGGGSIVNVSSLAGHIVCGPQAAYIAAKHAVIGLTKTAAAEYASKAIRVNAVAPGFTATPLLDEMGDSMGLKASQAAQLFGAQTPMGRSASAEEIANVVCFLLSDASSYMTGACVPVDGGYLTLGRA